MSCSITGIGSALPERVVTNEELSTIVDTNDEWIVSRTGIRERRVVSTETVASLAMSASQRALEDAGVAAGDLDLIIAATCSYEYRFPALGNVVGGALGASCHAFDISAACTGFIAALDIAQAYIETGRARTALVVAAEGMSDIVDWDDRSTCVLFGDGAGAVVLTAGDGVLATKLSGNGSPDPLFAPSFGGKSPFRADATRATVHAELDRTKPYIHMDGPEVFKFAVNATIGDIAAVVEQAGMTYDDVDHFVLHQANRRITEAARRRLGQPEDKFPGNIDRVGNTSAASVPILLDELYRSGTLKTGDTIVASAFGAGLSSGAILLRWTK